MSGLLRPRFAGGLFLLVLVGARRVQCLQPCTPVVTTEDYCVGLESPCSLTQKYMENCEVSEKCNTTATGANCDEGCQRCTPVCSASFLYTYDLDGKDRNELEKYCKLPECPAPSRYYADTVVCRAVRESNANCINPEQGQFEPQAAECPIQCNICNVTRVPTPEPTLTPTPPGRKKKITKKASAGEVLFGALYIEIAAGALLLVALGVLLWRRVKRRRKEERRNRAAGLYKNYR